MKQLEPVKIQKHSDGDCWTIKKGSVFTSASTEQAVIDSIKRLTRPSLFERMRVKKHD